MTSGIADSADQRAMSEGLRKRQAALAGHKGEIAKARLLLRDPAPPVRAVAVGALARLGALTQREIADCLVDPDANVRARACEEAAHLGGGSEGEIQLTPLLADHDPRVAEAAAWALGERGDLKAVALLAEMAISHPESLCREAAVAALGAIGDERGLPAILAATTDRPAVRRRAVLALAPFDGPEVDEALERARHDHDWQVRQAAEDLQQD